MIHSNSYKNLILDGSDFKDYGRNELIDFISYPILSVTKLIKTNRNKQWKTGQYKIYRILENSLYFIGYSYHDLKIYISFVSLNIEGKITINRENKDIQYNLSRYAINKDFQTVKNKLSTNFSIISNSSTVSTKQPE